MPILFPYKPDWEGGLDISLGYLTEVITSRGFREQRIANRSLPRKTVDFDLKLGRGELATFRAFMSKNLQAEFLVPDWTRWTTSTTDALLGEFNVAVSSVPGWVNPGDPVLLVNGTAKRQLTVDAVGLGTIAFVEALPEDWAAGTRVYPLMVGVFDQNLGGSLLTNQVGEVSASFSVNPGTMTEAESTAPLEFNGRELFVTKPNWGSAPSADIQGYLETVDFNFGVVSHFSPTPINTRMLQMSFTHRDNQAAEDFLAFYRRQKGQRGEFYMPTWEPDIDTSIGAAVAATSIVVPGAEFLAAYGGSTIYKALIAFHRDGTYECKTVSSVVASGLNTRINLDSPLAKAVNDQTVVQVCWLPVWRFATDDLIINWQTNRVAICQTTFQTLEDLP